MHDQASETVRELRAKLGMTQEEFAHALGLTVGTVNRWENRRFRPSKLARATISEFAKRRGVVLDATTRTEADPVEHHREVA
ncbi:MAG TPA: helix-turn-helix transcriptional regulator [Candidatus Kryptonia bacterium]|nr:helix-turn-helix transcriptional regulator [Candidatus Kryptonia bacterium]